jgi:Flavin-binding monooxygenase-like
MEKPKRVAIIGAGAAGLVAIKECLSQGLEPVCFEQNFAISFSCPGPESAVLKTSKEMMQFSDFPIPNDYPKFLSVKKCLEYLRLYAKELGLRKHIKMGRMVHSIRQKDGSEQWEVIYKKSEKPARSIATPPSSRSESPSVSFDQSQEIEKPSFTTSAFMQEQDLEQRVASIDIDRGVSIDYQPLSPSSKSYELQFQQDRSSEEDLRKKALSQESPIPSKSKAKFKKDVFDYIMVCTGHKWKGKMPEFEGMESFKGTMIHSQKYKV